MSNFLELLFFSFTPYHILDLKRSRNQRQCSELFTRKWIFVGWFPSAIVAHFLVLRLADYALPLNSEVYNSKLDIMFSEIIKYRRILLLSRIIMMYLSNYVVAMLMEWMARDDRGRQ